MRINLSNDKLVITFKYDAKVLPAIRSIPGRQFNVQKKRWEVPVENAVECLETLAPLGFQPTLEVKELAAFEKARIAQSSAIKSGNEPSMAPYRGDLPLYDFQRIGVNFLRTMPHALLADAPGLGKTIQTIAATGDERKLLVATRLVFCPNSLKYTWKEEIEKWSNDKVVVIDGPKDHRISQWHGLAPWMIANYELLLHDKDEIDGHFWKYGAKDVIITDEATRISNPAAKTTKALKKLPAGKRIALTGTPISNRPEDIWSIIDWISPRYLGSFYQFTEQYCVKEPHFNRIVGYKNLEDLAARVERFMLRRTKEEVLKDLPPKITETIEFTLSVKERKLYEGVRKFIISEIKDLLVNKHTLQLIPVKMLRLKQVTNHPTLITGKASDSSKLEALKEILRPVISSKEKAIVFTQFAEMAKILLSELNIWGPRILIGEMSAERRQQEIEEFINYAGAGVMIMTEAGAYGLNLQAASCVVHYDLPWSVAKLTQREGRAHRIGQTKPVTVYNLVAKDTIDEYVAKVLHKKQKVSVDILKDDERLEEAGLSEEDIKEILGI